MLENIKIYISHPYGGDKENYEEITKITKELAKELDYTFISPVHCFGFMYNDISYEKGLTMCLELLDSCCEMWVFGDYLSSKGCKSELAFCKSRGIPYRIFRTVDDAIQFEEVVNQAFITKRLKGRGSVVRSKKERKNR